MDAHGVTVCAVHGTDFAPYRKLLGSNGLDIPHVVITDGDPDSDGELVGITRGRELIGPAGTKELDEALAAEDGARALAALRKRNVFVGQITLELDLLPAARDAMIAAYGELESSGKKQSNFTNDLDSYISDGDRAKAILDRIGTIGKGRFAQRLAGHAASFEPPEYVAKALGRIRAKVQT